MKYKNKMSLEHHLKLSKQIMDLEESLRSIQGYFNVSSSTGKTIYKFLSKSVLDLKDKLDNEFCEINGAVEDHGFVYFAPDKKVQHHI